MASLGLEGVPKRRRARLEGRETKGVAQGVRAIHSSSINGIKTIVDRKGFAGGGAAEWRGKERKTVGLGRLSAPWKEK